MNDAARRVGYAVVSASKAFNLAGLKCALMVTADETTYAVLRDLPIEVVWRTGQFGLIAAVAAFSEESDPWLDGLLRTLDQNRILLEDLLVRHLPGRVTACRMPDTSPGSTCDPWGGATTPRDASCARPRSPSTTVRRSATRARGSCA